MADYYLGLMSGTSVDGIDAVVADLSEIIPRLMFAHTYPWRASLREKILATIASPANISLAELGDLDAALGEAFAEAAVAAVAAAKLDCNQITAIGSHGQTLFHAPDGARGFSLQAGDPNRIAEISGITTVADFRRRDIAAGGQGAPLVPAFHRMLFQTPDVSRAIVNIGGMANITLLPKDCDAISGFDTGPGNVLLDAWHQRHRDGSYDPQGTWSSGGAVSTPLLEQFLAHPYFTQPPPKSTGREVFCLAWLEEQIERCGQPVAPVDVQRTLVELTARTIADAILRYESGAGEILVCGGGAHNQVLMRRLADLLDPAIVESTEPYGLHPDWVEAMAFAWLAQRALTGQPGNVPAVTGARHAVVLGAIYTGRREAL
ncbi:MAG: anhydro-N-acetylmuramic acid kinase [Thiogranum sp.]|nr:anhydro-N-acetylmuramic acid kinase [Thiogranum sp.]